MRLQTEKFFSEVENFIREFGRFPSYLENKKLYYKIAHYQKYLKSENEEKRKEIEKIFLEFNEIMEEEEVKILVIDNEIKRLENLKKELSK